MLKICKICGVEKNISDFYTRRKDCKDCKNSAARQWRKDNPKNVEKHLIRMRERAKERRYGITQEQFDKMLVDQNNMCKICGSKFKSSKDTHIDHCHNQNRVRGLLCNKCNISLGQFEDNVDYMYNAIEYLEKYK